jgi:hypothetical protein
MGETAVINDELMLVLVLVLVIGQRAKGKGAEVGKRTTRLLSTEPQTARS